MKTIKFRGKRCDDGEWVYGYYARLRNEFKEWHCIMTEKDASENYIKDCNGYNMLYTPVNHNTVGQFTGLYDKNGEEIYEGDILLWTRKNVHIEGRPLRDFADRCEIFYDDDYYAFRFKYKLDCGSCIGLLDFSDDRADESYIEVIGNIHDNPELLKGEKQ